jgi:hypothetical protein
MSSENDYSEWESLPTHPEPADLGYDPLPLEVTESTTAGGHFVILPHDEEMVREEAFIIADSAAVADLEKKR